MSRSDRGYHQINSIGVIIKEGELKFGSKVNKLLANELNLDSVKPYKREIRPT